MKKKWNWLVFEVRHCRSSIGPNKANCDFRATMCITPTIILFFVNDGRLCGENKIKTSAMIWQRLKLFSMLWNKNQSRKRICVAFCGGCLLCDCVNDTLFDERRTTWPNQSISLDICCVFPIQSKLDWLDRIVVDWNEIYFSHKLNLMRNWNICINLVHSQFSLIHLVFVNTCFRMRNE